MTGRPVDRELLYEALVALRDADDPSAPEVGWAWRAIASFVDVRLRRPPAEHDDVRQRTLIKVLRGVRRLAAEAPAGAEAWLRRVHDSATKEHHRGWDPVTAALKKSTAREDDARPRIDRIAAPEAERSDADAQLLDGIEDAVMEQVEQWLARNVTRPRKRAGDRRRAQIAWLANVLGKDADAIREELGLEEKRDTLYKWVERGREQVLLPAVREWAADAGDEGAVPRELLAILEGTRRADAGKARPGRRSVSRDAGRPSSGARRARHGRGSRGSS
jgi:hypothetical protein